MGTSALGLPTSIRKDSLSPLVSPENVRPHRGFECKRLISTLCKALCYRSSNMDREELKTFSLLKYVADLFRHGFVVRRKGGRAGLVTYSELWRNARFRFELGSNGFGVYLNSACWWRTPFGLPFRRISDMDKQRILSRMQKCDRYQGW
jgi:hypothetical protein